MTERGMIFNAEMVRAVLDGRKTQTRRIMTVQPDSPNFGLLRITDSTKRADIGKYHWAESNATGTHARSPLFSCPFGAVGDHLWVRETFAPGLCTATTIAYCATHKPEDLDEGWYDRIKWTPSIHMPRWASRITLEITGVRVERLQGVSEADAKAEGIIPAAGGVGKGWEHRFNFRELWMGIYGADSWQANPWVWVIEFKRVEA